MFKQYEVDASGSGWKSPDGELCLWTPARTVLVIRMRAHGEGDFAALITERFDTLAHTDKAEVFFEMDAMESYDSQLRTDLTNHFRREGARLRTIHVLSRSKIVNMGVAVANLALRNIKSYPERITFMNTLDRVVEQAGGPAGFTASARLRVAAASSAG